MNDEESTIDLNQFIEIVAKRIKLILTITFSMVIAAVILSFFVIKPTYEAKTTLLVSKPQDSSNAKNNSVQYNDVMMYQNLVKTYSEIAKSRAVAAKTVDKLKLNITPEALQKKITVTPQQGTQILAITADSKSPEEAKNIIDAVSDSFIDVSKSVYPSGGDIEVVDKAQIPKAPVKPKKVLNIAIAFFLGLMISLGISFVLEYMDNTIKTENDIKKYLDLPVIGIIPKNIE